MQLTVMTALSAYHEQMFQLYFQFTDVQMTQVNVCLDGYEFNILYIKFLNRVFLINFKGDCYYHAASGWFCIA